jgi:hypothetical protein
LGCLAHQGKIFRADPEVVHTYARGVTTHEVEGLNYQLGVEQGLFFFGRGERTIYIFKEEKIPRIQNKDLLLALLGLLYYLCSSGKTARFRSPSAGGISLTIDVVTIDDSKLRNIRPGGGNECCSKE